MKSLTYSFEDPDAFFKTVERRVCRKHSRTSHHASDLLKRMLQAVT